jgi:hypothetical protein
VKRPKALHRLFHWAIGLAVLLQAMGFAAATDTTPRSNGCAANTLNAAECPANRACATELAHCHQPLHSHVDSLSTGTELPHSCEHGHAGTMPALLHTDSPPLPPKQSGPWHLLAQANETTDFLPAVPLRPPNKRIA